LTDPIDRLVRDTVRDLAAAADVITDRDRQSLAVHAADQAHTLRARRRGVVAVVVTLVTALAVGLPYGLRYLSSGPDSGPSVVLPAGVTEIPGVPTHVIDDTSEPIELVDGWYVLGNNLVLDRTTNTYIEFGNVFETLPSPDGRWVATAGNTAAYRVYDLQTGRSRRYEARNLGQPAAWSPKSGILLLVSESHGGTFVDLALIDVVAGEITDVMVQLAGLRCVTCQLTWMPSGEALALVLDDPDGTPTGIQVLGLDGERMATLPVRGVPLGPQAWSPDMKYVFVSGHSTAGQWEQQLVEVTTGQVVPGWPELANITQAQWIDNERFLTWEAIDGGSGSQFRAIASLWSIDGTLLERWIPPSDVVHYPGGSGALAIHLD
jgi:hypothetical protein